MKIDKERDGAKQIIRLSGRLETATAPMLQEVIDNELQGVSDLQIDMEELEYVSSAGLRVLLAAAKKMKAGEGTMVVKHVNAEILDVFKITGFNEILTIV